MDAKITNSNENKANPGNYSTQGFTGDPKNNGNFYFLYSQNIKKRIKLARFRDYVYFCIYKFRSLSIRIAWPAGLYFL